MPLVVFDLDGTLIDSRRDLANSVNWMLIEFGARPLTEADVTAMVGDGARVLVERALAVARRPPQELPGALNRFLEIYGAHLLEHTRPYDGIPELLDRLHGKARMAVLTNKPTSACTRILDGLQLTRYFNEVVGGDSEYPRKPDPAALLHLMSGSRVTRDETLMVGDSQIDLQTARNAQVACCLVRYGFGFPNGKPDPDVLIAESPEAVGDVCLTLFRKAR